MSELRIERLLFEDLLEIHIVWHRPHQQGRSLWVRSVPPGPLRAWRLERALRAAGRELPVLALKAEQTLEALARASSQEAS